MTSRKLIALCSLLSALGAQAYQVGDRIDAATLTHLAAKPDQLTVVNFFAAWCGSCRKEMPLLSQLHAQLDGEKVRLLGVDVDEDPKLAQAFQLEMQARGALTFAVINDAKQELVKRFKPVGMPATYILKGDRVAKIMVGAIDHIDQVLKRELAVLQ